MGAIVVRSRSSLRSKDLLAKKALGAYHRATPSEMAYIEIFPEAIVQQIPRPFRFLRLLQDLLIADVVYHEIGHHLARTRNLRRPRSEGWARKWEEELFRRNLRQRWWVWALAILVHPGRWFKSVSRKLGMGVTESGD